MPAATQQTMSDREDPILVRERAAARRSDLEVGEVEIYLTPWVSGTRSVVQFGPIRSELFLDDSLVDDPMGLGKAEDELLESLRDRTRKMGGNAVVGLAITLDPFGRSDTGESGMWLRGVGTAVRLDLL